MKKQQIVKTPNISTELKKKYPKESLDVEEDAISGEERTNGSPNLPTLKLV